MSLLDLNHKKILLIRSDNIGDLICTTPLIEAIKKKYPSVTIDIMVNTYNQSVLERNPNIRKIISYEKAKHRKGSLLKVYFDKLCFFRKLKKERYDYALTAALGFRKKEVNYVRLAGIRNIIGYADESNDQKKLTFSIPTDPSLRQLHEVEGVYYLGRHFFGLTEKAGPLRLYPDQNLANKLKTLYGLGDLDRPIGIHLSSRKVANRFPIDSFIELIKKLSCKVNEPILIFWAPGSENSKTHPGDDEKAFYLQKELQNFDDKLRLHLVKTTVLPELIAGVSLCDSFICCDGGTMHIAAALVNKMVAVFGSTGACNWHPWQVKHHLLQAPSLKAEDITPDAIIDAFLDLN